MEKLILPVKFSATFITKTFYPKEYKKKWFWEINTGRCYDWAYYAYCLWNNVNLWTTENHAWVKVGTKHYDSESCAGIKVPEELRCNTDWPGEEVPPQFMEVDEFKDFWNYHGGGRRFHWDKLVKDIEKLGLTPVRS